MGKRSRKNFEPRDRDFWPTPVKAVLPLVPWLKLWGVRTFAEACAGAGHLARLGLNFEPVKPVGRPGNSIGWSPP
jgi:hypothetical protein